MSGQFIDPVSTTSAWHAVLEFVGLISLLLPVPLGFLLTMLRRKRPSGE